MLGMVIIMKKFVILFILFLLPINTYAVTREEYNDAVANVSISAATTYVDDFQYSYVWGGSPSNPTNMGYKLNEGMKNAFQGIKTKSGYVYGTRKDDAGIKGSYANKFPVYCLTFVKIMVYHASNGKATFNYGDNDSYEKISVSELKRGDIIDFASHIAIFLDDGNDNKTDTFRVAEASAKAQVRTISRSDIETGWRIKDSALQKLDYSEITSSYDFHDRLDDYAPIINTVSEIENTNRVKINATDYKHYDLEDKSDVLEPESNGIVAYQITKSANVPATDWKTVNKTNVLDIETEVDGNGTYYVFVKDVGGNVTTKTINLTKIYVDKELPNLGEFTYEGLENSIKVAITGAKDNIGIKEYRYYLNKELVNSSKDSSYEFKNLLTNKTYNFYYEVVDNSGNVVKSQEYEIETEIDAKSIELASEEVYLVIDETYTLEPKVEIASEKYHIKYKSSDSSIASVSDNGVIRGIKVGRVKIIVSVGKTKKEVEVKVSPYNIIFDLYDLPTAYVDLEYEILMKTNPDSEISIGNSKLPKGLTFTNNTLKGIPEESTSGTYEIVFHAKNNEAEAIKKYVLYVKYNVEIKNEKLNKAYVNKEYNELINVNYPSSLSISSGSLPDGLKLVDNKIKGIPTKAGEYNFTIKADYMDSTSEREYIIIVSKYSIYEYLLFGGIIAVLVVVSVLIIKNMKMKKN